MQWTQSQRSGSDRALHSRGAAPHIGAIVKPNSWSGHGSRVLGKSGLGTKRHAEFSTRDRLPTIASVRSIVSSSKHSIQAVSVRGVSKRGMRGSARSSIRGSTKSHFNASSRRAPPPLVGMPLPGNPPNVLMVETSVPEDPHEGTGGQTGVTSSALTIQREEGEDLFDSSAIPYTPTTQLSLRALREAGNATLPGTTEKSLRTYSRSWSMRRMASSARSLSSMGSTHSVSSQYANSGMAGPATSPKRSFGKVEEGGSGQQAATTRPIRVTGLERKEEAHTEQQPAASATVTMVPARMQKSPHNADAQAVAPRVFQSKKPGGQQTALQTARSWASAASLGSRSSFSKSRLTGTCAYIVLCTLPHTPLPSP